MYNILLLCNLAPPTNYLGHTPRQPRKASSGSGGLFGETANGQREEEEEGEEEEDGGGMLAEPSPKTKRKVC